MELNARVKREDGMYWAEIVEFPGCFASGESLDELKEAITEAVALYLEDDDRGSEFAGPTPSTEVDEIKLCVA